MNEYGLNSKKQWVWGKKLSGVEWSGVMECSEISVTSRKKSIRLRQKFGFDK